MTEDRTPTSRCWIVTCIILLTVFESVRGERAPEQTPVDDLGVHSPSSALPNPGDALEGEAFERIEWRGILSLPGGSEFSLYDPVGKQSVVNLIPATPEEQAAAAASGTMEDSRSVPVEPVP